MKRLFVLAALACLLVGGVRAEQLPYLDKLPELIDREIFFGDPEITGGQLSPDGKFLSFRKPHHGKLNVWVKRFDEAFDDARPVTADTLRPVRGYFWTYDSKYIIYIQDKGGDENYHAYAVDPYAGNAPGQDVPEARDLTPIDGVRVFFYGFTKKQPDIMYIGLNDRDERYHDLYKLRISTGERTLMRENSENLSAYIFDLDGNLRLASRETDDGGTEFLRFDGDELVPVYVTTNEENANILRFHKDGKRVYMATDVGDEHDLSRLVLFDPVTLEEEFVESDPEREVDFGGAVFSEKTEEVLATFYLGDRLRAYIKDKEIEKAYKKLQKQFKGAEVQMGGNTLDDRFWLVTVTRDTDPGQRWLYDMETGDVEFLYRPRPDLPSEALAEMKPIRYKSSDGLEIPAYLTMPKGIKAKNLPLVVLPHGGPWARDYWGYDPYAQFLANRGYAVLQPNFRSSTGYGKKFYNAGKRQWGELMQDDLTWGVKHLVEKGIVDREKVAIFGGSYGGYATLAGVAFTPDVYCCAVSYVGVSNLLTLLNSIPPYWETARKFFNEHVGDPNNPEDLERLKRQSPLFSADKITAPLLVVQGANDPRVKKQEADQIVVAMRDLDRDVEYLCAPDEGHGFSNVNNRMAMTVAMEKFFAKHMGGRFQESIDDETKERLDEITVDVGMVTLEELAADPEKAMKAPLPELETARIKPMTAAYQGLISTMGQEISLDMTRSYAVGTEGGRKVWHAVATITSPMIGSIVDSFVIDPGNLLPIRKRVHQGPALIAVDFGEKAITGKMDAGPQQMPIDVAVDLPVYGDGSSFDMVIESLPLEPGYETTLRVFDSEALEIRPMYLEVTGVESVDVPAGTYDALKVEIKPLDGNASGGGTLFVREGEPRCIVRSTTTLSAQMGGGTITIELLKID